MKKNTIVYLVLFVLLNAFIFTEALMPGDDSSSQSDSITNIINNAIANVGKDEFEYIHPTKVAIDGPTELYVGDTHQYRAVITPTNVTNYSRSYSTSTSDILLISPQGFVRAVKPGTGVLRVTCDDNGVFGEINITVKAKPVVLPTEMTVANNEFEVNKGCATPLSTITGAITFKPEDCNKKDLTYELDDNVKGKIENGYFYSYESGNVNLIIKSKHNESLTHTISINISTEEALKPGKIEATINSNNFVKRSTDVTLDFGNTDIKNVPIGVEIGDRSILSYSNGKITGLKAGKTSIRFYTIFDMPERIYSPLYENIEVKNVELEKIEVGANGVISEFKSGTTLKMFYTVSPSDVTEKEVKWSVDNKERAYISKDGVLVALKQGHIKVTATHVASNMSATYEIDILKASQLTGQDRENLSRDVRKTIGHFGLFALDGIVGFLYFNSLMLSKKKRNIMMFSIGAGLAITAELLQLIPAGRSCQITDMLINVLGFYAGLAVSLIVLFIIKKIKSKKGEKNEN